MEILKILVDWSCSGSIKEKFRNNDVYCEANIEKNCVHNWDGAIINASRRMFSKDVLHHARVDTFGTFKKFEQGSKVEKSSRDSSCLDSENA